MSPEEELVKWLSREEKTFKESLDFAIKAWSATELNFSLKYETIIKWFSDSFVKEYKRNPEEFDWQLIEEFLNLKCSPFSIDTEVRSGLVEAFIVLAKIIIKRGVKKQSRKFVELYFLVVRSDLVQGCFLTDRSLWCRCLDVFFMAYNCYIKHLENFLPTYEDEFFTQVLAEVTNFVRKLGEPGTFPEQFKDITMKSFLELIILLKSKKLNYFEDVLMIETTLYFRDDDLLVKPSFFEMPAHIVLQHFEYAIVKFRGYSPFYEKFLVALFEDLPKYEYFSSPGVLLMVTAQFLYLFRKYDIQLKFECSENETALQYIGKALMNYVELYSDVYLYEVLDLLCSAWKFNPLILEKNIFSILSKLLVVRKTEKNWNKYQEFLILLMEMFRKLSKGEKLVTNLLKSIKEYLKENKVSKKLKRKMKSDVGETPIKKMKMNELDCSVITTPDVEEDYESNFYLQALLSEFRESKSQHLDEKQSFKKSWLHIYYAWPAHSAGVSFSKFISTLMSKPSLVIWKTLMFSFSECIDSLETSTPDENLSFLIDFNAALLCQYLCGTRLAEQSDKFWKDICNNQAMTCNILKKFGQTLLKFEYNNRTMNAFLEICYHLGQFDLIRSYYLPDSIMPKDADIPNLSKNIHQYLDQDEWTLIEQRIVNFGKNDCKVNMNRLRLQRLKARILFDERHDKQVDVSKFLLSTALTDVEQLRAILGDNTNLWLIQNLTKEQKKQICDIFLMDPSCVDTDFIKGFSDMPDFIEIILINVYKYLVPCLSSKKSILATIDFDELFISPESERIQLVINAFNKKSEPYSIKKYAPDSIESLLKVIKAMPVSFCNVSTKTLAFVLNLVLYRDLLATKDNTLIEICFGFFTDIMHFGEPIKILDYFDIEILISIFPPTKSTEFYEILFNSFNRMVYTAENYIIKVIEIIKSKKDNLNDDYLKLSEILTEYLSHQTSVKKFKKYSDDILQIYASHVNRYFSKDTQDPKEDKEFVDKTLSAYTTYICSLLGQTNEPEGVDEQFRKVCKIYIGHSINCRNHHAIRLLSAVLQHRALLHFDSDEIDFVLQKYWDQVIVEIKSKGEDSKNMESVMQLVLKYKTKEDFVKILTNLEEELKSETTEWISKILLLICRCDLSTIKGAIFNDYFKRISFGIIFKLKKDDRYQFEDMELVFNLLECQRSFCENSKIPISIDSIDNILMFLISINIKKLKITDTNIKLFCDLHQKMTAVCAALMKYRHLLVTDRIPQLMYVFKDLMQALCWYKCDRQKDASLESEELDNLTEIAQKLENLMHLIAHHSLDVKKVAPFILIFTISLMVTNKRPTTLYPKIKTHIENICYDLIACCDHRVGNFILRCCNDAMKEVYETLCKDFKKYHKFKGKI